MFKYLERDVRVSVFSAEFKFQTNIKIEREFLKVTLQPRARQLAFESKKKIPKDKREERQ